MVFAHVVLAADDVGDPVANVIDHITEKIQGLAVGTYNDKILDIAVGSADGAQHLVLIDNGALFARHFETDHGGLSPGFAGGNFCLREVAAGAIIAKIPLGGQGGLAFGFKLLPGAKALIGLTAGE